MNLPPDMFPMTSSVRPSVLKRFTHPESLLRNAQIMSTGELAEYLRSYTDTALSPLDAVLKRADDIGDPTLPPPNESAILAWIGASFDLWEQEFPLEPELTQELRKLKPAVTRVALCDDAFTAPGLHPAHQLLDALHAAAIGWQPDLGRSGEAVTRLISETLTNIAGLGADEVPQVRQVKIAGAAESARRLEARGARMGQRAADVERAQLRSTHAKQAAAKAINIALGVAPLPDAAGDFLRGPWYESAQLVLLKFGNKSREWQQMLEVTKNLVTALGPKRNEDNMDAQASASALSTALERWLLSLQHQQANARSQLGELEYLLLRALGGQPLEGVPQLPIETIETARDRLPPGSLPEAIAAGQWLILKDSRGQNLRMQVVLRQENQQQLLLCRHSGQQPRSLSFKEFKQRLNSGSVTLLNTGNSFSRALAMTAGIKPSQEAAMPPVASQPRSAPVPEPPKAETSKANTAPPASVRDENAGELLLPPLGTWLGFHDVDPPLLAKLAMHDSVRQLIIFVNRKGTELRRVSETEYLKLIQEGLVDILETRSNFREEVERARRRLQRHGQ